MAVSGAQFMKLGTAPPITGGAVSPSAMSSVGAYRAGNTAQAQPALGSGSAQAQPYSGALGSTTAQAQGSYASAPNPFGSYNGTATPFAPKPPLQDPGNNLTTPGYSEQALNTTQNRLLEDPFQQYQVNGAKQAGQAGAGETYLNQNLGSLDGPGQGEQYWQGVQGQFQDPFAGEQFTRQATQNMSPTGPAGAFYSQAMDQYGDFTGYSGPQNSQGQYGASQQQLQNGTQGQQNMSQIAGGYGEHGEYTDPNLAAGQYQQTQGAFGDMPIANFDPFYDRARQLGVQSYNQGAAGRGVYGSSEALSGVGNVITDIEAQRANRSFDAEMQRAQEQRARQQLLGEQARAGDLSSLSAFGANLAGAETYGNINNQMGQLQNQSQSILGQMANNADTQALGAQNSNIAGLNAFGDIANSADARETDRYTASTNAMNNADRTGIDRMRAGADIADMADDNARGDFDSSNSAATSAANVRDNRLQTGSNIAHTGSADDLSRLDSFNNTAHTAEADRASRQIAKISAERGFSQDVQELLTSSMDKMFAGSQADQENTWNTEIAPALEQAGYDQQQISQIYDSINAAANVARASKGKE